MKKFLGLLMILLTVVLVACQQTKIEASSLVVTSDVAYVNVDAEITINVTVLPSDATDKVLEWTVVDPAVATVTQAGVLKGISVGETILTIKVSSTPDVSIDITIHVVDRNWPNDRILAFAGFELPMFTDFTFVEVEESENILTLNIKGTTDDAIAITAFRNALLELGWEVDGSFDNHAGRFKHDLYDFIISMHNEFEDGGDTIEFKIIKSDSMTNEWPNDEILEHFGFELPEFEGFTQITVVHLPNGGLEILLSGFADLDGSFHAFEHALEDEGWIAAEDNNHHIGRFDKEGVDAYITYHEGHDNDSFEISIIPLEEHHHDIESWDEANHEIEEHFGFTLPEFTGFTTITLTHLSNGGLEITLIGFEDLDGLAQLLRDSVHTLLKQ